MRKSNHMQTMDDEKFVIQNFKFVNHQKIIYFGRFFRCFRVEILIKSFLFSKSWIDSSSNSAFPPDFYNNKHKIMMEVMRIDDCVNTINGKHIPNSFQKENTYMRKAAGKDYKTKLNGSMIFVPNTDNDDEFNFDGYLKNFERVLNKHSNKVELYRKNYPKCKECILLLFDESNNYVQIDDEQKYKKGEISGIVHPHICFLDSKFISIIQKVKADYVVWVGRWKCLYLNGKPIKMPQAAIYDIKRMKENGYAYNHSAMLKIHEKNNIK